jgi:hypothetical protein
MKRALLCALFLLTLDAPVRADRDKLFWSTDWPAGVPDPTKWALVPELGLVTGNQAFLASAFVIYELHAQAERPGLWQVSRFKICYNDQPCDPETLVWLRPDAHAQVFYRFEHRRNWKHLWLGQELYWYRLPEGSPEYKAELANVRKIFYLDSQLRDTKYEDRKNLTF